MRELVGEGVLTVRGSVIHREHSVSRAGAYGGIPVKAALPLPAPHETLK